MLDLSADLQSILDKDELAERVIYRRPGYPEESVDAIVERETVDASLPADVDVALVEIRAWCKTSDVPYADRGDQIVIDETTYYVQQAPRQNQVGFTLLILSKDP